MQTNAVTKNNRYVTGQSTDPGAEFVFVQYKGHTLQGSYDGGFVYARKPFLPSAALAKVSRVARVRPYYWYDMFSVETRAVSYAVRFRASDLCFSISKTNDPAYRHTPMGERSIYKKFEFQRYPPKCLEHASYRHV